MKKYLLFLTSLSVLAVPKITFGQTITGMLCSVTANVVRPVAIFIVVTLWVVTGILFLVAQGEPGKLATAKNALIWASAGTVIIILAGVMATIIANSLGVPIPVWNC